MVWTLLEKIAPRDFHLFAMAVDGCTNGCTFSWYTPIRDATAWHARPNQIANFSILSTAVVTFTRWKSLVRIQLCPFRNNRETTCLAITPRPRLCGLPTR